MKIRNDGNVGIGAVDPGSKLHVIADDIFGPDGIKTMNNEDTDGCYIGYGGISSMNTNRLRLGANNTEYMCILDGGYVGIGTTSPSPHKLKVNGHFRCDNLSYFINNSIFYENLTVNGTFSNPSDSRAKLNQELYDTSNCLHAINNISIKKYDYAPWFKVDNEQYKTDLSDNITVDLSYVGLPRTGVIGFIAQDLLNYDATRGTVTKSYAAFTDTSNNSVEFEDFHRVDKVRLITVLMGAIQEQQKIIDAEKSKTTTLQTQVADLIARVTALENANS